MEGRIPGHLTLLASLEEFRLAGNSLDGCVASDLGGFTQTINPQKGGVMLPACRPEVYAFPREGLETREGSPREVSFWVTLAEKPAQDVKIGVSSSDPGEGVPRLSELVFKRQGWYVNRIVWVGSVDDNLRDGPQEYAVVLAPVESADPDWDGVDPPDVLLTNLDNEQPGLPVIEVFGSYPDTIPEGGQTTLFWWVPGATSFRIEPGVGTVAGDTVRVSPEATTTYTLTAARATATDEHGATGPSGSGTGTVDNRAPGQPTVTGSCGPPSGGRAQCTFTATATDDWTSSGDLTYSWDGDETGRSITRTYTSPGTKTARATATDEHGATGPSGSGSVNVIDQPPIASFTSSCDGLRCTFASTSTDDWTATDAMTHRWSGATASGNGTTATATFSRRGVYTVTLTVTDAANQSDTYSETVDVSAYPVAKFTAGCSGRQCVFDARDSSDDVGITDFFWTLGTETASGELVSHEFDSDGTYSITLRVTDTHEQVTYATGSVTTGGDDQLRSNNTPPQADFTFECNGLECTFTSISTDDSGIVSYQWSTGDDAQEGSKPVHVHRYGSSGSYTVTLAVRDEQGALAVVAYRLRIGGEQ